MDDCCPSSPRSSLGQSRKATLKETRLRVELSEGGARVLPGGWPSEGYADPRSTASSRELDRICVEACLPCGCANIERMDPIPEGLPKTFTAAQMRFLTGLSYARLVQLGDAGIINRIAKGQYSPDSVARYIKFQRESAAGPFDLRSVRIALMQEKLALARLDRSEREGKLLEKDEVRKMNVTIAHTIKARLLAVPRATAPRLVGLSHASQAEGVTMDAITTALEELAALAFVVEPQPRRRKNVAAAEG